MTNFLYYSAHVVMSPVYLLLWCETITPVLEYKGSYTKIFLSLLYY